MEPQVFKLPRRIFIAYIVTIFIFVFTPIFILYITRFNGDEFLDIFIFLLCFLILPAQIIYEFVKSSQVSFFKDFIEIKPLWRNEIIVYLNSIDTINLIYKNISRRYEGLITILYKVDIILKNSEKVSFNVGIIDEDRRLAHVFIGLARLNNIKIIKIHHRYFGLVKKVIE